MSDEETLAVYDAKVADYAKIVSASEPDDDLKRFLTLLPESACVLDLGCGPGHASAHMRAAGHRPDPIDASSKMVEFARETHKLDARMGTFDDIPKTAAYDGVWANFSLLHAPQHKVRDYIADCAAALKFQGHFHLGMKTGRGEERDKIGRRYAYFPERELTRYIMDAGMRVLNRRSGEEAGLSGEVAPYVILQAIKHA